MKEGDIFGTFLVPEKGVFCEMKDGEWTHHFLESKQTAAISF